MALTGEQRRQLLILKVGEVKTADFPAGLLAGNVELLWELHGGDDAADATLRDLLVRRDLIELALGEARNDTDFTDGDYSEKASQRAVSLLKALDSTEAAIAGIEAGIGVPQGAAIGELATVAPESPPRAPLVRPYGPDATDPAYWGSPYGPGRVRGVRP